MSKQRNVFEHSVSGKVHRILELLQIAQILNCIFVVYASQCAAAAVSVVVGFLCGTINNFWEILMHKNV